MATEGVLLLLLLSSCILVPHPTTAATVEVHASGDASGAPAGTESTSVSGVHGGGGARPGPARGATSRRQPPRAPPGPPTTISKAELTQLTQQLSTLSQGSEQYWSMLTKMVWVACRHGFGSEASALFSRALGAGMGHDMKLSHEQRMKLVKVFSACASATDDSRVAGSSSSGGGDSGGTSSTSTSASAGPGAAIAPGGEPTKWAWISPEAAADGRCPSPVEGPNPVFLLIGAEKSGTTSVFEYLGHHQSIARVTRKKEVSVGLCRNRPRTTSTVVALCSPSTPRTPRPRPWRS